MAKSQLLSRKIACQLQIMTERVIWFQELTYSVLLASNFCSIQQFLIVAMLPFEPLSLSPCASTCACACMCSCVRVWLRFSFFLFWREGLRGSLLAKITFSMFVWLVNSFPCFYVPSVLWILHCGSRRRSNHLFSLWEPTSRSSPKSLLGVQLFLGRKIHRRICSAKKNVEHKQLQFRPNNPSACMFCLSTDHLFFCCCLERLLCCCHSTVYVPRNKVEMKNELEIANNLFCLEFCFPVSFLCLWTGTG